MDFIKSVIEGREYGKFIFTRNLSKVIQMAGKLGKTYGILREDFAYIDIHTILDMYTSPKDMGDVFQAAVENGKKNYWLHTKTRRLQNAGRIRRTGMHLDALALEK